MYSTAFSPKVSYRGTQYTPCLLQACETGMPLSDKLLYHWLCSLVKQVSDLHGHHPLWAVLAENGTATALPQVRRNQRCANVGSLSESFPIADPSKRPYSPIRTPGPIPQAVAIRVLGTACQKDFEQVLSIFKVQDLVFCCDVLVGGRDRAPAGSAQPTFSYGL